MRGRERGPKWLGALALTLALGGSSLAGASEGAAVDPVDRARLREMLMTERSAEAEQRARQSALAAYRLVRRRAVAFLPAPERRGEDARAVAAALHLLRRTAGEARSWRAELARSTADREALEAAPERAGAPAPATGDDPAVAPTLLQPPTRGRVMAAPGVRVDQATGGQRRFTGVEYLGRLNEPVVAVEGGTVRRIEPLAQGGFAVVVAHGDGLVSIVSGLRRADVQPGQGVERGQALGLTGRNLDGAPVLGFELWQAGQPVDPRPLLEAPAHRPAHGQRRRDPAAR
jgi:murein DD-endopeptidase MepM/ murein hydrolase activator NlpD